jgi:hypothetical protein
MRVAGHLRSRRFHRAPRLVWAHTAILDVPIVGVRPGPTREKCESPRYLHAVAVYPHHLGVLLPLPAWSAYQVPYKNVSVV